MHDLEINVHVVVVEEEAPVVRLVAWFLKDAGFSVETTDSGDDVATRVLDAAASIVVLNSRAAAERKRRWLEALRRSGAPVKVLDVSPSVDVPDIAADARLLPPFDADDLVQAVRRLV